MIPPEGVRRKGAISDIPHDEGYELLDGDFVSENEDENADEEEDDEQEIEATEAVQAEATGAVQAENEQEAPNPNTSLQILSELRRTVEELKKRSPNELLPFFSRINSVINSEKDKRKRKCETQVDGPPAKK